MKSIIKNFVDAEGSLPTALFNPIQSNYIIAVEFHWKVFNLSFYFHFLFKEFSAQALKLFIAQSSAMFHYINQKSLARLTHKHNPSNVLFMLKNNGKIPS